MSFTWRTRVDRPSFIWYPVVHFWVISSQMVTWSPSMSSGPGLDATLDPNSPWGGGHRSLAYHCSPPLAIQHRVSCQEYIQLWPQALHCYQLTSWSERPGARPPEDRGLCGLGGDFGKGEALWLSIHIYLHKCVSTQVRQQEKNKKNHACVGGLCVRLYPKGSNSVLSLQADILIITSLVKWKCEPRKRESAKKDSPLISWLAGPLVVCSAAGLWSAGGAGGWTQCPWL